MKTILITGGAGYIGSHACVEFLNAGYDIVVLDNLCNSSAKSLDRVRELTGLDFPFIEGDIRDRGMLDKLFRDHDIDAVIHFAGLKSVGESVEKPLFYYDNNLAGSVTLFEAMQAAGVKTVVFSSSATVYGDPASVPIREDFPVGGTTNPYGTSKLFIEKILQDVAIADPSWKIALLRYFNPVGAHKSGRIGEDPRGIPNNLMPYISQVAVGRREHLNVFGNDYPTPDGTGVRDYIHVVDLAVGHVKAVEKLDDGPGVRIWNLGTGCGYSVVDMAKAFEKASGRPVPYRFAPRRAGDIAQCYADPAKAERELGWKAQRGLEEMCEDTWRWQSMNPDGFDGSEK
jgi:UDP-glucose 4-epimerase